MRIASALLLVIAVPVLGRAQSTVDSLNLAGRTNIMFGIGLTGARSATASPGFESTHTTGEVGSFAFNHWVSPEIGVLVSASVLNADATSSGGIASTNVITPILFGISYSPRALALTTSLRPFVSAAVGPYVHTVSDAGPGTANSTSESVAGARFAAGANWFVARHFMLSLEGDYHAVGRFSRQDAATSKASGFGMLLGFGFSWGGNY
jgi:hypothetical protein